MDKLGTYALVAALKEISERKHTPERRCEGIAQNERWISLRSCARELPSAMLEPPAPEPKAAPMAPAAQESMPPARDRATRNMIAEQRLAQMTQKAAPANEEQAVVRPLSTTPERRSFNAIRQIEMRHQSARNGGRR